MNDHHYSEKPKSLGFHAIAIGFVAANVLFGGLSTGRAAAILFSENFDNTGGANGYTDGGVLPTNVTLSNGGNWNGSDTRFPPNVITSETTQALSGTRSMQIPGNVSAFVEANLTVGDRTTDAVTFSTAFYIPTGSTLRLGINTTGGEATHIGFQGTSNFVYYSTPSGTFANMGSLSFDTWYNLRIELPADMDKTVTGHDQFSLTVLDASNTNVIFQTGAGFYFTGSVAAGSVLSNIEGFNTGSGPVFLDNFSIVSAPVPEPSAFGLAIAGFGLVWGGSRRRRACA